MWGKSDQHFAMGINSHQLICLDLHSQFILRKLFLTLKDEVTISKTLKVRLFRLGPRNLAVLKIAAL